jgi:hypothetical protein
MTRCCVEFVSVTVVREILKHVNASLQLSNVSMIMESNRRSKAA